MPVALQELLFIHQGFPGQYKHIIDKLAQQPGIRITGLGIEAPKPIPKAVRYIRYGIDRGTTPEIHPLASEIETKIIRASACARALEKLKQSGYQPSIICAHPGWGECMFVKDVYPHVPLLTYQEFFYRPIGSDLDFDPEFRKPSTTEVLARSRMKNLHLLSCLESSDWGVTPTRFQYSHFPAFAQSRISVIHDGIDLTRIDAIQAPQTIQVAATGQPIDPSKPVVTFVNRTIEPYRGAHTFIRSIPHLQQLCPDAQVVIVGSGQGASYGKKCENGEWKDRFLADIEGAYDPSQVIFTERVPHQVLTQLMKVSWVHVYLTYPFVLSWSLLEAMACSCAIVGSDTEPVREVIDHGGTGLLTDFFNPEQLATSIHTLINDRGLAKQLGKTARERIEQDYSLRHCLAQHLSLINLVAGGSLKAS